MGLRQRDIIVAALLAVFSYASAVHFVPSLLLAPIAFLIGVLSTLAGFLFVILTTSKPSPEHGAVSYPPTTSLVLSSPEAWSSEVAALRQRSLYHEIDVLPSSSLISLNLDALLDLIQRDFVKSWYTKISSGNGFPNEVDRAIRAAVSRIADLTVNLDHINIAVTRILPILNNHLKSFTDAETKVRGHKLNLDFTETDELDVAIAKKYRDGRLHPAASLAVSKPTSLQQQHLRKLVERILPLVMPSKMCASPSVLVLVREIVACAVLLPVMQLLADPDILNQIIEAYGRSILQERKTIRKLRAALDEHAPETSKNARNNHFHRINPGDNERTFEKFVRAIRQCDSLSEARRFRSEIQRQMKRDVPKYSRDVTYLRRLEVGKRLLDQRVATLSARGEKPGNHARQVSSTSNEKPSRENATLREVLYDSSGLSYFMEYMDRLELMNVVQFWIVVDGFRNPLEHDTVDFGQSKQGQGSWTESDRQDITQISDAYLSKPELNIEAKALSTVQAFIAAGNSASWSQYEAARKVILTAQTEKYSEMNNDHFAKFKESDLFFKWLTSEGMSSIPRLSTDASTSHAAAVPDQPRKSDGNISKNLLSSIGKGEAIRPVASSSDIASAARASLSTVDSRRSLDDTARSSPLFDEDYDTDPLANSTQSLNAKTGRQSPNINSQALSEAAIQATLNNLVEEKPERGSLFLTEEDSDRDSIDLPRPGMQQRDSDKDRSNDSGQELEKQKPSLASLGLLGTPAKRTVFSKGDLFGEDEEKWEDEGTDTDTKTSKQGDEIREAAPGDLGLAELIEDLSKDVDKLESQQAIVANLTKKAELTNNTAELRILRKSAASLEKDINTKQLQKQQYIVQESDNSLYGKASVSIKNIMVGTEQDGHEFAIYVIEVERQAGEKIEATTWAVARRYSEFHDLHRRLRTQYPNVKGLEFPRRQMVLTLQKDFLKKRRAALERYLRELLKSPAICRSFELRAFLSQQSIRATPNKDDSSVDRQDFVSRIYNSVTDGMEEFLGNIPALDQLSLAGQNLLSAASLASVQASTTASGNQTATTAASVKLPIADSPVEAAEAQAEISAFDNDRDTEMNTFIKSICDMFLELFQLNQGNNWLRGRAVVVVLQQLLGGTIERRVRETFKSNVSEASMVKYLALVKDTLWPDGKFRTSPPERTKAEKARSRREASLVLATLMPDLAGGVVGRSSAAKAGRRVFATLNNERLNMHIAYTILDELVEVVFGVRVK